jgi:hypothetical protein
MKHLVNDEAIKPGDPTRMRPLMVGGAIAPAVDVSDVIKQLDAAPELWNQYKLRTGAQSPHYHVDDIWVRYNAWKNYNPRYPAKFGQAHHSTWYPSYAKLPAVRPLIFGLMNIIAGEELGGVLITRIPAGSRVERHRDAGWHAEFFNRKFAVMLKSDDRQAFCFDNEKMVTEPGEAFEFDNSVDHWVVNQSDQERITMIVCIKTS